MTGFVLDCSIAVTWFFEDETSPETDALLDRVRDEGAVVPALWHWELANVLLQAERRGRIAASEVMARLALLRLLPIRTDDEAVARVFREVPALARAQGLTSYDAAYLDLAIYHGLPLATKDKALIEAASRMNVPILP
jgi:predicted nucleic acid-binding protein